MLGFRVWDVGFRVWDLGFRIKGLRFGVQGYVWLHLPTTFVASASLHCHLDWAQSA